MKSDLDCISETENSIEQVELIESASSIHKNPYYLLFESVFPQSKVDIVSGELMFRDDAQNRWVSAFSSE